MFVIIGCALYVQGARHLDFMLRDAYTKRHKVAKLCREMLTPFAAKLAVHGKLGIFPWYFPLFMKS